MQSQFQNPIHPSSPLENAVVFQNVSAPIWNSDEEPACNAGDTGLIAGSGRSHGGEHGNPLQYSCLENLHGQRSLTGYSSWDHKESDATEVPEHSTMARAYMAWL